MDLLGLPLIGRFTSERENVDEDICALGEGAHRVEVDLMQPLDPEAKPAVHQPPLNHIGLWVDDLPKEILSPSLPEPHAISPAVDTTANGQ